MKKFLKTFFYTLIPVLIVMAIYGYSQYQDFDEYKKMQVKEDVEKLLNK